MRVAVRFPQGETTLTHDEPLELGRGSYGITDPSVSRKHLQILFSKTAETVIVKCLSRSNPTYVWRKGESNPIILHTDEKKTLKDGDRISLLRDSFYLGISITTTKTLGKRNRDFERSDTIISKSPSFESPKPKRQRGLNNEMCEILN